MGVHVNYIWEALLAAGENGIEEKELRFLEAREPSPYVEVSFADLNTTVLEKPEVRVNPLYRFSRVFSELFSPDVREYSETRALFLDVFLHYIARTDLLSGMHRQEYYFLLLGRELEDGAYGKQAAEAFSLFDAGQQRRILSSLTGLYRSAHYREIFRELVTALYENAIIYEERDRAEIFYLYVGRRETSSERKRIRFLADTFLPVNTEVKVFYDCHFGILDLEETMVTDRILLI